MLLPERKEMRVNTSRDLIDMVNEDDNFLKKILTGIETGCFLNNPQTKRQSSEWKGGTLLGQRPRKNGTRQESLKKMDSRSTLNNYTNS
ncbi:hypothetical protein TNCV_3410191 [Trichonephila clavipes]|nr:hypothetical protein TNCV_3410191 [Trichonephila clavipes]